MTDAVSEALDMIQWSARNILDTRPPPLAGLQAYGHAIADLRRRIAGIGQLACDAIAARDDLMPDNYRVVGCEACGTEGTIYSGTDRDGDYLYADKCEACEGTGGEIVEVFPIDEADLIDISEAMAGAA